MHAKDWRRLAPLSPTYAKTPFKIMDNMLKPDCKSTTNASHRAKTPIKTREQQRAELDGIGDELKKKMLLNRLQIWGTLNEDELYRVKQATEDKAIAQRKVSAHLERIKNATGRKWIILV